MTGSGTKKCGGMSCRTKLLSAQDFEFRIKPTIKLTMLAKSNVKNLTWNIPIKPKNFAENQDENHSHVDPRLLHVCSDTLE